jgi:DNA (cytosine-5)-methyltransferase 1
MSNGGEPLKVLSLFSGVGGFDMGLTNTGKMTTAFMCEIDKHARSVLDYHWPEVPKWDDVTTLTGAYILEKTGGVDVVAWGSPCQDLSIAGKRAGLTGERSGLFHHGIRIIKELRELSNGKYPTWSIWENVAGALSSNKGADFGEVLYEMDEAGACFSEWSLLDAQYFGVPQRRRRVFVISCFDSSVSERCPEPLLPVAQSLSGDSAKGKPKGKATSGEVAASVGAGSESFRMRGFGDYADDDTFSAIKARDWKDHTDLIVEPTTFVLDRASFNQGENAKYEPVIEESTIMPSLVARGPHAVVQDSPVTYTKSRRGATAIVDSLPLLLDGRRVDDVRFYTEPVQTLQERMGTGGNNVPVVVQETTHDVVGSLQARSYKGVNHENARDGQLVIMNVNEKETILSFDTQFGSNANVFENQTPTLKASQQSPSIAREQEWKAYDEYNDTISEIHHSLRAGTKQSTGVLGYPTMIVRRLTPLECERLMGWPDGHTAEGINGTVSDTQRYKMCGNGVASPVAEWIGRHITAVHHTNG